MHFWGKSESCNTLLFKIALLGSSYLHFFSIISALCHYYHATYHLQHQRTTMDLLQRKLYERQDKKCHFFGVKNYPLLRFDTYYIIIMHSLHTLNLWMFKKSVSNCLIIYSFKYKNVFIILERKLIYLFFQKLQIATEYSIWNTKIFPVWIYAV